MIRNYKFQVVLFLFVSLLSCGSDDNEVDCTTALPEPNWFELGFFNSQGEPLIGTLYQQESFRLFNSEAEVFLAPVPFGDPTRLGVSYNDIASNTDYFIELTESDNDTLNFTYETIQGTCFLYYNLQQVIYNGQTIQLQNTNRIDLIK